MRDAAREVEAEIERQVTASPEVQQMIAGLEKNHDQNAEEQERSLLESAEGAELLVMGSRGHGGFTGLLLGSVSEHVVGRASCPVVVVRPRDARSPDSG